MIQTNQHIIGANSFSSQVGALGSADPLVRLAEGGVALTPDTLILYCSQQLGAIDKLIQAKMASQRQQRDLQGKLGDLQRKLSQYPDGLPAGNVEGRREIMQAYKDAYDAAPPDMKGKIQEEFSKFYASAVANDSSPSASPSLDTVTSPQIDAFAKNGGIRDDNDFEMNGLSEKEMKAFTENVGSIVQDIGNSAELEMISLPALMSQRQMAVQMATNIMSKVNETLMAQVGAIGK